MSTQPRTPPVARAPGDDVPPAPSVFLQPIAPPVTFGLLGFFGATMVYSTWVLGWWGVAGQADVSYFFVFNAMLGGVVQFIAGIWSFRARDYIASSLFTTWGAYHIAFGVHEALVLTGTITPQPLDVAQPAFALWFIPLGVFTLWGAVAALSPERGNATQLVLMVAFAVGSMLMCVGLWTGVMAWTDAAQWAFVVGACAGWYLAMATLLLSAWQRVILPLGEFKRQGKAPGGRAEVVTEFRRGQPGVRQGGP